MFSPGAENSTQLFVRSNIHMSNLDMALKKHLHLQKFVDVTISCEGRTFKCHRLILAAASPLFENLFIENPAQHPIIIMPLGIKAWTIQALIDFMYKGHVNVSQRGLKRLVRSAEMLQISGLDSARKDLDEYCHKDKEQSGDMQQVALYDENDVLDMEKESPGNDDDDDHDDDDDDDDEDDDNRAYDVASNNGDGTKTTEHIGVDEGDVDADADGDGDGVEQPENNPSMNYRLEYSNESNDTFIENSNEPPRQNVSNDEGKTDELEAAEINEEFTDSGLSTSPTTTTTTTTTVVKTKKSKDAVGKIRVKSQMKLFSKTMRDIPLNEVSKPSIAGRIPSTDDDVQAMHEHVNGSEEEALTCQQSRRCHEGAEVMAEFQVKTENMDYEAESIICQPNVSFMCTSGTNEHLVSSLSALHSTAAHLHDGNSHGDLLKAMLTQNSPQTRTAADYHDHYMVSPTPLLSASADNTDDATEEEQHRAKVNTERCFSKFVARKDITKLPKTHAARSLTGNSLTAGGSISEPSLQTVMLRNPRCNQQRSYSHEALYNALMAVKHGESIYRASREYQVPRKTLRNWMKRWDIKSQYPMPKQLKDAANKKKLNGFVR